MIDVVGVVRAAVTSLSIALGVTTTVVFHLTGGHLKENSEKINVKWSERFSSEMFNTYSERNGFPFFRIES